MKAPSASSYTDVAPVIAQASAPPAATSTNVVSLSPDDDDIVEC
jgi:hypothetical protein